MCLMHVYMIARRCVLPACRQGALLCVFIATHRACGCVYVCVCVHITSGMGVCDWPACQLASLCRRPECVHVGWPRLWWDTCMAVCLCAWPYVVGRACVCMCGTVRGCGCRACWSPGLDVLLVSAFLSLMVRVYGCVCACDV